MMASCHNPWPKPQGSADSLRGQVMQKLWNFCRKLRKKRRIVPLLGTSSVLDGTFCFADVKVNQHTYFTLRYVTYHSIPLHYTTLHCIQLHSTTLRYITLHYITLHCIHRCCIYAYIYISYLDIFHTTWSASRALDKTLLVAETVRWSIASRIPPKKDDWKMLQKDVAHNFQVSKFSVFILGLLMIML